MYFRFQDPWFAALLLFLWAMLWLQRFWGKPPSVAFSSNWAIDQIVRSRFSSMRRMLRWIRVVALLLIVVSLMRPQTGQRWVEPETEGIDIMLGIDLSGSMHAHDFEHEGRLVSRLEMVKLVISQFIDNRPHDRIGMLVFAEEPFLISPLTRNHSWLKTLFQRIEIGMIEPNATAIGDAIGMTVNHLRDLEGDGKILILLSDGENNAGMLPPGLAGELAHRFGIKVYTVGVGKSGSVLMPRHRGGQIIKDRDGHPVMDWVHEDMDEFGLREVAQVSEGRFFRATHSEALANIYTEIDKLEKRETTMVRFDESKDLMMFPMGLALLLLFLEIVLSRTLLHKIP